MTQALASRLDESTELDMFDLDVRVELSHDEIISSRQKGNEIRMATGTCPDGSTCASICDCSDVCPI